MMLTYCSKQENFSYKGMVAGTQLAALDNNANAERPQALMQSGEHAGQEFLNEIQTMGLHYYICNMQSEKSNLSQNIHCMTGLTSYNLFEVHVHRHKQKILCRDYQD